MCIRDSGRTDDMLVIRGVNVFPSQIEFVLTNMGLEPNYVLVVDRVHNLDTLEVKVEMTPEMFSDSVKNIENIERQMAAKLHTVLNISCLLYTSYAFRFSFRISNVSGVIS